MTPVAATAGPPWGGPVKVIVAGGLAVVALRLRNGRGGTGSIESQHGIGGVRLHQTLRQVQSRLGLPVRTVRGRNGLGRYRELRHRA